MWGHEDARAGKLRASLEHYLLRKCTIEKAIRKTSNVPGLDVLAVNPSRQELNPFLQSDRLQDLIKHVRAHYDIVILDTPPVLVVEDANWLSLLVDGTILVVSWGRTREDALWEAASRLRLNHAPLMGTVINLVEPRIQAKHSYGGTLKYRQHARSYIAD